MTDDAGVSDNESDGPPSSPAGRAASSRQLLAVTLSFGSILGLLLGCFALVTGVWLLVLTPLLVIPNRLLVMGSGAKRLSRALWLWPFSSVVVASVVVLAVPSPAVPAVVIVAAVMLPILMVIAAVIDARAAGTTW